MLCLRILNDIIKYAGTIKFLKEIRAVSDRYSIDCKNKNLITQESYANTVKIFNQIQYNLKILNCYIIAPKIKDFPYLPRLQTLVCDYTRYIERIPYLPNLKNLECAFSSVKQISSLPNLKFLECTGSKITVIPHLPALEYLSCMSTEIKEIPFLPKLKKISCDESLNRDNLPKQCEVFFDYFHFYK